MVSQSVLVILSTIFVFSAAAPLTQDYDVPWLSPDLPRHGHRVSGRSSDSYPDGTYPKGGELRDLLYSEVAQPNQDDLLHKRDYSGETYEIIHDGDKGEEKEVAASRTEEAGDEENDGEDEDVSWETMGSENPEEDEDEDESWNADEEEDESWNEDY